MDVKSYRIILFAILLLLVDWSLTFFVNVDPNFETLVYSILECWWVT